MSPTAELRWVERDFPYQGRDDLSVSAKFLQQKWVAHHIPAGKTEAAYEWRDVPTVKDES